MNKDKSKGKNNDEEKKKKTQSSTKKQSRNDDIVDDDDEYNDKEEEVEEYTRKEKPIKKNNNNNNSYFIETNRGGKGIDVEKGFRSAENDNNGGYLYKLGSVRKKKTFNYLFLTCVGASLVNCSFIVAFLENNKILKPFYSNEIIVIMTLGLIIASIYGIFHQLKIYTVLTDDDRKYG